MAHNVEALSRLLKKTPDQVVAILTAAGIKGKTHESNISAEERKILMSSLSKRSGTKSSISVSRKTPKTTSTSTSTSGVKIKVKSKREAPKPDLTDETSDETVQKAKQALEEGRLAEEKVQAQDAKRHDMVRQKKEQDEKLQAQKTQKDIEAKEQKQKSDDKKPEAEKTKSSKKNPKRLRKTVSPVTKRKELHVARHNPNRKLKKKERTKLSQKVREDQAQHAFHKPVDPIVHEVKIPETIKISDLALSMATKAGEVLKVMMGMGVMATLNDVIDQDTKVR